MSIRAIREYKDFQEVIKKYSKTVVYEKVEELEKLCSFIEHNLNWKEYKLKYTYSLDGGFVGNSRCIPVLHIQIENGSECILFDCRISNCRGVEGDKSNSLYQHSSGCGVVNADEAIDYLRTRRNECLNSGEVEEIPF